MNFMTIYYNYFLLISYTPVSVVNYLINKFIVKFNLKPNYHPNSGRNRSRVTHTTSVWFPARGNHQQSGSFPLVFMGLHS